MSKVKLLPALNGLRAIATIGIFLFHAGLFPNGKLFVTFFFMLSGFMMYYTKRYTIQTFTGIQKIKKLYPLHIATMIISAVVFFPEIIGARGVEFLPKAIVVHSLLLQAWLPDYTYTLNRLSWYLSVTLFLYAVSYPLVRLIRSRKRIYLTCIGTVTIISAINAVSIFIHALPLYSNPMYRLLEYSLGMIIAECYLRNCESGNYTMARGYKASLYECAVCMVFVVQYCFTFLRGKTYYGEYTIVFSLALYIFAQGNGFVSKLLSSKPLQQLAKYSFEFYMIHELWLRGLRVFITEDQVWLSNYALNYLVRSVFVAAAAALLTGVTIQVMQRVKQTKRGN